VTEGLDSLQRRRSDAFWNSGGQLHRRLINKDCSEKGTTIAKGRDGPPEAEGFDPEERWFQLATPFLENVSRGGRFAEMGD